MQQNRGRNIHVTTDNGRSSGSSSRDSKYGESEVVEYQLLKNYKTTGVTCVLIITVIIIIIIIIIIKN
jgi:hypothetical protein